MKSRQAALALLKDEHRSMAAVIHALQFLVRRMEQGKPAPPDLIKAIVQYLTHFPEHLHHPAEDRFIFAPLRARTSEAAEVLDLLEKEHAESPIREKRLLGAMQALNAQSADAIGQFDRVVQDYANFYWAHMMREETIVLPLAERLLNAGDWEAAAKGFEANADPMFGGDTAQDFKDLFRRIVNIMPAPEGLGAPD